MPNETPPARRVTTAYSARQVPRLRAKMTLWARDPGRDGAANWFATALPTYQVTDPRGVEGGADGLGAELARRFAAQFAAAHLFYVAPDMVTLARAAGEHLPEYRLHPQDLPAQVGFMALGEAITGRPSHGQEWPIRLVTWGPSEGGTMLTTWSPLPVPIPERRGHEAWLRLLGDVDPATAPHRVMPLHGHLLAANIFYPRAATTDAIVIDTTSLLQRTILAIWLLMGQKLTVSEQRDADRATRRAVARQAPGLDTRVSYVYLRRRPATPAPDSDGETSRREYRHQWWVQGHWHNQWYPSRGEHRPVWINAHLAGPEDKPLLGAERVNILRR